VNVVYELKTGVIKL